MPPFGFFGDRNVRSWSGELANRLLTGAVLVVAACGPLLLAHVLIGDTLASLDERVAEGAYELSSRWPIMLGAAHIASFLGSTVWLTCLVAGVVLFLIRRDQHRLALLLVAGVLGGVVINKAIKRTVDRSRPEFEDALAHASGSSFPSGHAMNSIIVYGLLLVLVCWQCESGLRQRLLLSAGVLVTAIAASRVALGVHYLTDITAGLLLGLVWTASLVSSRPYAMRSPPQ